MVDQRDFGRFRHDPNAVNVTSRTLKSWWTADGPLSARHAAIEDIGRLPPFPKKDGELGKLTATSASVRGSPPSCDQAIEHSPEDEGHQHDHRNAAQQWK